MVGPKILPRRHHTSTHLDAARLLAQLSARVEPGGVTVSPEDQQSLRHWVFCDRPLPIGGRCALPVDHTSPCARRAPWLTRR
ncbi:hypothetical protein [Micromonospora sp. CA-244673]|uniref:hypothetical protein n=1 Tax=Micromonospora sp. CA-244673 TaxID=3239958 RepID=UPI003D94499A